MSQPRKAKREAQQVVEARLGPLYKVALCKWWKLAAAPAKH